MLVQTVERLSYEYFEKTIRSEFLPKISELDPKGEARFTFPFEMSVGGLAELRVKTKARDEQPIVYYETEKDLD